MAKFTAYIVLIIIVSLCSICQCSDGCFYHPEHAGKKCYDEQQTKYTCCPLDRRCDEGKCISLSASPPTKHLSMYTDILIGAGVGIFAIVAIIIIGATCWHRKQMNITEEPYSRYVSFSKSVDTASRTGSSVGFRTRSSASPISSPEATVNIHIPSANDT